MKCICIYMYMYIYICQIRHTTVGKRSAFERCILFLVYSLLSVFSPQRLTTVLEIRFVVKTSGLVTPSPPGVGIMTPKGSGTNGALVKWWESEGICFPRNPKAWWDSDFYSCHGFVWTRKSKQKLIWLKGFNLLAQPQEKASLNHLLLKIVWKVKTQRLWKHQTLLSTNTPFNFILVTLPNKIGHFCHLGNDFFSFVDTHLHREKFGSCEAFPLKKTTRRFPAAVNFSLRLCAKKSFLSATTALGLQGERFGSPEV